jgi:hypothetical protein
MAPVPPLVALMVGVLGAAVLVRHLARQWRRTKADLARGEETAVEEPKREAIPKLRRDPATGVYRP